MASSGTYFRLSVFQDVQFQFLKYNILPLVMMNSKLKDISSKTPNSCLGLALARSVGLTVSHSSKPSEAGTVSVSDGWPERAQVKERVKL